MKVNLWDVKGLRIPPKKVKGYLLYYQALRLRA